MHTYICIHACACANSPSCHPAMLLLFDSLLYLLTPPPNAHPSEIKLWQGRIRGNMGKPMAWLQENGREFTNLPGPNFVVVRGQPGSLLVPLLCLCWTQLSQNATNLGWGKKSEKPESSKMVFFDICSALRSGEIAEKNTTNSSRIIFLAFVNSHSAIYLIPNWDYAAPICWKQAASALVASSVEAKLSTSIKSSWLCCKHGVT